MSVAYSTPAATGRMNVVQALINSLTLGAATGTPSNGSLVIGTSSFVTTPGTTGVTSSTTGALVVIPLPNAGVTVSGKVLSLIASAVNANATAAGTAATAAVINNAGTIIVAGLTAGTSGTDVVLGTTTVTVGLNINVTSATLTHP